MIRVLFFAKLKEQLGTSEVELAMKSGSLSDVKNLLIDSNPSWSEYFTDNLLCAINQGMAKMESSVSSGDEVAFFPPVTGG